MKTIHILSVSMSVLLFWTGCVADKPVPIPKTGPYVVMNGTLEKTMVETRGQIVPLAGLPSVQLPVGIVTVNYTTENPAIDQPDLAAWSGTTADITRGYFGGEGLNPATVTNGEINYTNYTGTAIQRVFYKENGQHYFTRVYYPFLDGDGEWISSMIQTPQGAEVVIRELDGSQDVMCSNLAWGNVDNVVMTSDAPGGRVVMSHLFSLFRVKLKAENAKAAVQFGAIDSLVLRFQPFALNVNMMDLSLSYDEQTDYLMVGQDDVMPVRFYTTTDLADLDQAQRTPIAGCHDTRDAGGVLIAAAAEPVEAGYVMAPPATSFRFEAKTAQHLWVQGNVSFATPLDPFATSAPGTAYDVTFTFMESYEIEMEVQPAKEWWFDSVFD